MHKTNYFLTSLVDWAKKRNHINNIPREYQNLKNEMERNVNAIKDINVEFNEPITKLHKKALNCSFNIVQIYKKVNELQNIPVSRIFDFIFRTHINSEDEPDFCTFLTLICPDVFKFISPRFIVMKYNRTISYITEIFEDEIIKELFPNLNRRIVKNSMADVIINAMEYAENSMADIIINAMDYVEHPDRIQIEDQNIEFIENEKTEGENIMRDIISKNTNALSEAAKLAASKGATDTVISIVRTKLPENMKDMADNPLLRIVLANIVCLAAQQFYPDNQKIRELGETIMTSSYLSIFDMIPIKEIVDALMAGVANTTIEN